MPETTTLEIGGAQITVETSELFRAWFEKHISKPPSILNSQAPIFRPLAREGERYVSSIVMPDGRLRHTFLLPQRDKKDWNDGMEWAKELGGDLPDRIEQAMMFAFMPEEFEKAAYWSNTQHAGNSGYAWFQIFEDGDQYSYYKGNELLVCAVRREFSDSVTQ